MRRKKMCKIGVLCVLALSFVTNVFVTTVKANFQSNLLGIDINGASIEIEDGGRQSESTIKFVDTTGPNIQVETQTVSFSADSKLTQEKIISVLGLNVTDNVTRADEIDVFIQDGEGNDYTNKEFDTTTPGEYMIKLVAVDKKLNLSSVALKVVIELPQSKIAVENPSLTYKVGNAITEIELLRDANLKLNLSENKKTHLYVSNFSKISFDKVGKYIVYVEARESGINYIEKRITVNIVK